MALTAAAVTATIGFTAPLWLTIAAVAVVSIGITSIVSYYNVPNTLDTNANMLIDDLQGE